MSGALRRRPPPTLLAVLGLVLILALGGCGGSVGSSSSSTGAGQTTSPVPQGPGGGQLSASQRARLSSFAACLRQRGVTMPSGRAPGGQGNDPPAQDTKTQRALQACQAKLPQGVGPPGGGAPGGAAGGSTIQ